MQNSAYTEIVSESLEEIKFLLKDLQELKAYNALSSKRLLNMNEAAKYTGRSRKTFQNEFHRGLWTFVKVANGHPKFSKEQLDKDIQQWTQYSRFRKHERKSRG